MTEDSATCSHGWVSGCRECHRVWAACSSIGRRYGLTRAEAFEQARALIGHAQEIAVLDATTGQRTRVW